MNTVTDLCNFVAIFAFILSFDYRQCQNMFYSVLKGFFQMADKCLAKPSHGLLLTALYS